MRSLFILLSSLFLLLISAHAEDLAPIDVVLKQGMQVKMGELTGAGSKFSLKNLEGLILPEGVILKSDCSKIVVKKSSDPKISDIIKIEVQQNEIAASEFIGFVVR